MSTPLSSQFLNFMQIVYSIRLARLGGDIVMLNGYASLPWLAWRRCPRRHDNDNKPVSLIG